MAAQDLPYDVIGLIVTQLKQILQDELRAKRRFPDARLAPYAAICKSWNPAIERETFRKLKLSDKRMESAERALQKDPARRLAMKRISFEINYPSSISRRRDLGERQVVERDAAFSRRLLRLFRFLECVGNSGVHRAENLTLELDVTSYSVNPEDKDGQAIEESDSDLDSDSDSDDEEAGTRFKYDPTHLRYVGEALPTICCVQGFEFPRNGANIWSSTFTTILMAMDGLEYCNIAFDDAQTLDPGTRVRYRKALGETLCKIPPTCKGFHANFEHQSDGINAPSAYDPSSLDMLSVGMRNLSTQLVELSLDSLAISPSLFWPDDAEDAAAPYWPRLQHVYVNYAPTLASGEWLVQADEEEEAEPARKKRPLFAESLDRPVLDCERTNRLFLAIGKATRNMPALQEMELEMSKELSSEFHFRYKYDKDRRAFEATWDSYPSVFQASTDVLDAFSIAEAGFIERPALPAPTRRPGSKKRHVPSLVTGGSIYRGVSSITPIY